MSAAPAQKGFQLDLNLCTGCSACAVACAIENELPWGTSWRWIETFNMDRIPGLPVHHLSLACNHCADAPCMEHCPALAYTKDPVTGAVLLNQDHCIGCKYCTWACPYDAPRYEPDAGVVSKCTFCHERQLEGHSPACVSQCPTGALRFGDVDMLVGAPEATGFPSTEVAPSIRFVPLRGDAAPDPEPWDMVAAPPSRAAASKVTLATEWPLVVFTLLCAGLVGFMVAPQGRDALSLPLFLALSGLAAGASTLHLGRKLRAWRAVLNVRRSWLSREVALFSSFVGIAAWDLSGIAPVAGSGTAAAVVGTALLFAMDQVYKVTRSSGLRFHSARVLLTGVFVAGLVQGLTIVWLGAVVLKALEYGSRKARSDRDAPLRPGWSAARLVGGLAVPAALVALGPGVGPLSWGAPAGGASSWGPIAWALFAMGEVIDRCEFYADLTVPSPTRQMKQDLAGMLSGEGRQQVTAGAAE